MAWQTRPLQKNLDLTRLVQVLELRHILKTYNSPRLSV